MEGIFGSEINRLASKGWLYNDTEKISFTREGQVYASSVYETFYTEEDLCPPKEGEVQFGISELIT
jgi:hypothetical protein